MLCAVNDKSTDFGGLKNELEASGVEADASPALVVPLDADCKAAADAGDDEDWTCLSCLVSAEHKTYPKRIAQIPSATFCKTFAPARRIGLYSASEMCNPNSSSDGGC